jgi:uncharacterized protein YbaA (DUF1428 family)
VLGDNVREGKLTDFRRAMQAKDDAAKGSLRMKSSL